MKKKWLGWEIVNVRALEWDRDTDHRQMCENGREETFSWFDVDVASVAVALFLSFVRLFCGRWARWFWPELFMSHSSLTPNFSGMACLGETDTVVGSHNECIAEPNEICFFFNSFEHMPSFCVCVAFFPFVIFSPLSLCLFLFRVASICHHRL